MLAYPYARRSTSVPFLVPARETVAAHCVMRNDGSSALVSSPPNPIHLGYRSFEASSGARFGVDVDFAPVGARCPLA